MARLGDICTIYSGTGFPVQYQGTAEGQYPFYKVGDIAKNVTAGNKYLVFCENYVEADIVKIIKGTVLPSRTVVFAKIGEAVKLNRRAITSCECLIDNNAMGIAPNESVLTLDYFFHYMCSLRLETLAEATTVPSVKKSLIEKLDIPLPSLLEQEKISTMLNKVSELITLRKEQLAKLDRLVKSRFVELFGKEAELNRWPCCTIGDVADVCVGVVIKPTQYYTDKGIPAFRSLNIGEMHVKDADWVYFTEEGHQKNQKSVIRKNDVLVVRSGAPGTACVATEEYDGYNAVDIIIAHPDNSKVNSVFLAAYTNMPHGMIQIREKTGGAAQQHFNVGGYKAMRLIMPPMELQEQFAAFVEQTDKSKYYSYLSIQCCQLAASTYRQEWMTSRTSHS